jgi:asparagine synthase (glutamine-hydrolysing)
MCGICGSVSANPTVDRESVARMQAALTHRGPDAHGRHDGPNVALAMRRLSIIDLQKGAQPIRSEDGTVALVANAEIYNHVELRGELKRRGHRFSSRSDCEPIVHLYEEHGVDCVQHLRGMFAFALWDSRRQRLLLARDRMGEKPLYLSEDRGRIVFASELKALLEARTTPVELDPAAIDLFFHCQYVPEPRTPVVGIRKLPAGHVLVIDVEPWRTRETCYWRLEDVASRDGDPTQILREELDDLGRIIIRSDVPVGIALSGGVDSGALAALAVRHSREPLHAFCVGYAGRPPYDERRLARELADRLGIAFHSVALTDADVIDAFPRLVAHWDDPIADYTGFTDDAVSRLARQHDVPVLLQGQGADELFWGYGWVRQALAESQRRARDSSAEQTLAFYECNAGYRAAVEAMPDIYAPRWYAELDRGESFAVLRGEQLDERPDLRIMKLICATYLAENGIAQGDRLSMANSVEMRLPFVDHRFVEAAVGLQKAQPDHDAQPKARLRRALHGLLDEAVVNRPKRPSETPERRWHRALLDTYGSLLPDGYLVQIGVLSGKAAIDLASRDYEPDVGPTLPFKALVLEAWCRLHVASDVDAVLRCAA